MIAKYVSTLAVTVAVVTLVAASLKFATSSQVLSGKTLDESSKFEFTIDADSGHTYVINADIAQFLETHIGFTTEGPPQVVSANVQVTPKQVSWTENRKTITAPGAAIDVQLDWNTPSGSANGSRGSIYLDFPQIPGYEGNTVTFRSGPYQVDSAGRYVIRQVTTYRSAFQVAEARFVFALAAGLPIGILLHALCWVLVLRGENRKRVSALLAQGAGLPRTFYPNPIVEWTVWLLVLGSGAFTGSMMAGFSIADGFMSSSMVYFVYIALAVVSAIAFLSAYFTGKRVLTVRVEPEGISYARGRENVQWTSAVWSNVVGVTQKSRTHRGKKIYWIEIEFSDNRRKLKIGQSITDYAGLRDLLASRTAGQIR
jgi:hypothetical protein